MDTDILRIPILPLGMVNAHVVISPRGTILVDAGLPGTEKAFARALDRVGRTFRDVSLIVVTHAHVDHAGGAARLRELTGAPIVGHEADLAHFTREVPMTFRPTGFFGRCFARTRAMLEPYTPFDPDIRLHGDECLDLTPHGIDGRIRHVGGHTSGSIAVELATGDALVGDLLASGLLLGGIARTDRAIQPPFEDDAKKVAHALDQLVSAGNRRFFVGHGGPIEVDEVSRHARRLVPRDLVQLR